MGKFLLFAVLLFIQAELQSCGKKYLVETAEKGYDDDYRLRVGGSVKYSKFDTASDHDVEVRGNVLNSNVHNYGGKRYKKYGKSKYGYGDDDDYRLTVGGDVLKSRFDTASDHDVRVKGNMKWTNAHNYGGAKGGKNDGLTV